MTTASEPTSVRPSRRLRRWGRYATAAGLVALVALVAVYVAARLYLPTLVARKIEIEAWLSGTLQHPVHLGRLDTYWRGMNPGVRVYGVTVNEDNRRAGIRIGEVQVNVDPVALLRGRVEIYRLVLVHPSLALARNADGRIGVAGLAPTATAPPGAGFAGLLALSQVEVRDGELRWEDADDAGGALSVTGIQFSLRNAGVRHRLALSAVLPPAVCRDCAVTADITGDPLAGSWNGEVSLRADGLDTNALPLVVRERLPDDLRGRFDVDVWSDWRGARPRIVRGRVSVAGLRFPFGARPQTIGLRQLAADVLWQRTGGGWRLDLDRLMLGLMNAPWSAGRLRLEHGNAENVLKVDHVDLDDLTRFVVANQTQHPLLRHWAELRPSGTLDALHIKTEGSLASPSHYEVSARLVRLGTATQERLPSVAGLSGRISFDNAAGSLEIDAKDFSFNLPRVFRAPLDAAHARGAVQWQNGETAWHVSASDLQIQSEDGKGSGALTLDIPHDTAQSPVLKLRVDFRDGNGAHAARYYPVHKLPAKALKWMESSFVDGRVTSGYLVYDGPIREFPFDRGQGKFELHAQVRDGVYRYLPGWTPLTQGQATVAINGADALITGSGRIGTLQAHDIRVEVAREPDGVSRVVRVRGRVDGAVAETLRVLQQVKTTKDYAWRAPVRAIASASGTGALDLDVLVPLKPEVEPSFFAAYHVKEASLKLDNGAGIDAATGVVRFTDAGLHDSSLQGNLFGGPTTLVSAYQSDGLHVRVNGRFLPAELLRGRRAIAQRLSGKVDWSLDWKDGPNGAQLQAGADFREMRSRLPPPLDRLRGGAADRVTVSTDISQPDTLVLSVAAGATSGGKLAFDRVRGRWRFDRGRIDFGRYAPSLPQREGLELGLNVDAVDVDQWLPLLETVGVAAPLTFVTGVQADVGQLALMNRDWGRSFLHFVRFGKEWKVVVDGDAAAGEGTLGSTRDGHARLRFDLTYLRLPPGRDDRTAKRPMDPHQLPAVELRVREFQFKGHELGELDFAAAPDSLGWRVDRLNLTRPELKLGVDGVWRRRGEHESSEFNINWHSDDMGASLDALGLPGQMSKGKARVQAHLLWPGAPTEPQLAGMDGRIEVSAENGRFLKIDPGAARLFGLLDLRSIGHYLTLDFSPAFGKGFAFDAIHGKIAIDHGNARTDDLVVSGPSLSLGIVGRVGLAAEDYDLAIEASPHLGSTTLTLTSWGLFGPQVAAAVLALQRLFKRQIQEGTRITYLVKGPWDNPTVTKLSKQAAAPSAPAVPTQ
jgi:uncharacterized protein (TIGR02099 family)